MSDILDAFPAVGARVGPVLAHRMQLVAEELLYIAAARQADLSSLPTTVISIPATVRPDVKYSYSLLANKKQLARSYYNILEARALNKKCPSCLERSVAALDHYLPKKHYAHFSITPANLIPICTKCNTAKSSRLPSDPAEWPLHPYFDDLDGFGWLNATVAKQPGAPITYHVTPMRSWTSQLGRRVEHHFKVSELNDLWASSMSTWLAGNRTSLKDLRWKLGARAVRHELLRLAASYEDGRVELWRPAAWRAWADSRWFCEALW